MDNTTLTHALLLVTTVEGQDIRSKTTEPHLVQRAKEDPEAKEDREVMLLASDVAKMGITRTSVRTMEVKAVETKFEATHKILRTIRGRIKETLREITKHQPALKEDAEHLAEYTAYVLKLLSFVSSTFSEYINIPPTALDTDYNVELADGKSLTTNTILRGCTLNLQNHLFKTDLLPIELGERSGVKNESRLEVISSIRTQGYIDKGCQVFLVQMMKKEETEASEKQIEDVPVIRDFLEVFLEDFSGLPLTRQVEFHIELIPGDAPVAHAPYRLAPAEMKN
ncbi:hypothetical protein Tco_0581582 [Tanacetum coccineum]